MAKKKSTKKATKKTAKKTTAAKKKGTQSRGLMGNGGRV